MKTVLATAKAALLALMVAAAYIAMPVMTSPTVAQTKACTNDKDHDGQESPPKCTDSDSDGR
jgi:hypothetical protein